MYVIATVICPNFHFSVSPHVPFLNLLFKQIANSNEYLLAKFGFDTAVAILAQGGSLCDGGFLKYSRRRRRPRPRQRLAPRDVDYN